MKAVYLLVLPALAVASRAGCEIEAATGFLSAHYPFDGDLTDASGKGHGASGPEIQFADGREGQALKLDWQTLEVPSHADLQLAPGFAVDCWVYFDDKPTGYQPFVIKEKEYQLRLDDQREGGEFSFFVYLDGWEPRIRSVVPEPGKWYHLVASWSGTEISLEVNGRRFASPRIGTPKPGNEPVRIGKANCRIDELKLLNPNLVKTQQMREMIRGAGDAARGTERHFGGRDGWTGWRQEWGATMSVEGGVVQARLPDSHGMLLNPSLDVDAGANTWVSVDIRSATAKHGNLTFITDAGSGIATLPVWDLDRTCMVNLASHPAWRGKLKLLGISFPDGEAHEARIRNLWIFDKPEGSPFLYVRNLAPGRAILRVGREEGIIAVVRNLGTEASDVRATLTVPRGVRLLDEAEKRASKLMHNGTQRFEWTVSAEQPTTGAAAVSVASAQGVSAAERVPVEFLPKPDLPRASYVPAPKPAKSKYLNLMHYCPLWKADTHYGWERIDPWPERKPAIGWYDEGTPEVADWHIKYALEHGVNAFIYCWYRAHLEPKIEHRLGHAIHEGLFNAKYRDKFKFCIMWENGCAKGVKDVDDLLDNVLPFWIENYFTHPSYLKLGNMPLLFVWQPRRLLPQLGGPEGTRKAFDAMRARCRKAGLAGLRIIACMNSPEERLGKQIAESGWDAVTGYALRPSGVRDAGIDPDGMPYREHAEVLALYKETWQKRDACTGSTPDIPNVVMGWDTRPWGRARRNGYIANPQAKNFEAACRDAKALVDAKPAGRWDSKLVVFDNWTEFGEGHYIEPTSGLGFTFLNAIKRVFCTSWAPEAITDMVPEDVGLEPPQKRYEEVRAGFGDRMPWQPRRITGDLLAHWEFERVVKGNYVDSSPNDSRLAPSDMTLEPGRGGQVLRCGEGGATCPAPAPFFHTGGITVALWCKPDRAEQSDRWMLNTVSGSTAGYRLGLSGGHPAWQVPKEPWSHGLRGPEPLPVGEWSHITATFDNRMMRLYVNGAEVGTLGRPGFINPSREVIVGGYSPGLARARFHGWLDDVRIYRRVLSPAEIAALATGRLPESQP